MRAISQFPSDEMQYDEFMQIEARRTALELAIDAHHETTVSAEQLVREAEILLAFLTSGPLPVTGSAPRKMSS